MKYAEYNIDNNKIEVYNSLLGKETILLNGNTISEKHSFWGSDHYFNINDDNYSIRPFISLNNITGIAFKIHKNGLPIQVKNCFKLKKTKTIILTLLVGLLAGIAFGYTITSLILQ